MATRKKKKTAAKAAEKPPTKAQLMSRIATDTGLTRKDVEAVFESLNAEIKRNVGRRGPGYFNLPGLLKIKTVKKPATKSRKGINPFTGEEITIKAKPARKAVKVSPLKGLKEMI
ncbi:HU family DNA-binding protein [Natronospira bacteriovora]|uniref:Viral histone-like protein n=1 Tax=Natronospira bacteriovora TaxID=3069753 RepID=A0ABU0W9C9_9GAMM|nr:HU family DNA-binding protein [Natronospira sp. AB-CW4]MDQ2070625.1 HU family DNA-binding protein [Natronospira sp. AB-CW4]